MWGDNVEMGIRPIVETGHRAKYSNRSSSVAEMG